MKNWKNYRETIVNNYRDWNIDESFRIDEHDGKVYWTATVNHKNPEEITKWANHGPTSYEREIEVDDKNIVNDLLVHAHKDERVKAMKVTEPWNTYQYIHTLRGFGHFRKINGVTHCEIM